MLRVYLVVAISTQFGSGGESKHGGRSSVHIGCCRPGAPVVNTATLDRIMRIRWSAYQQLQESSTNQLLEEVCEYCPHVLSVATPCADSGEVIKLLLKAGTAAHNVETNMGECDTSVNTNSSSH